MDSTFSPAPLVVESKASLVRQRLFDAIMNGELKPGDRLVLDEIARNMGVSKIPLREALSSLEASGLVVQTLHSGPRVAPLPVHELRGIYLLREEVETLAMRVAAPLITATEIDVLADLNDQMRGQLSSPNGRDLTELNTEFHLVVARATTYQSIVETVGDLLQKVRRYRAVGGRFAANWDKAVAEHDAIIAALRSGDIDSALTATHAHVRNQRALETAAEPDDGAVMSD